MRIKILCIGAFWSMTVLAAATLEPLNVKPGLWQVTMTSTIDGLPKPNTRSYKSCLKKEDLSEYPFTDPAAKCTWTVVSSTASEMKANGTCTPKAMGSVEFKISLTATDSENVSGRGELHMNNPAGVMNGTYAGAAKWIGATCPADLR